MDGLMKGKHAQKNLGAVGAMAPTPLSLKTQTATMGQVCFTAISSNRAYPAVFIALRSV